MTAEGMQTSSSLPALPTIHEAASTSSGATAGKDAQRTRMMKRRTTEAPKRQAFINGLINQDLQQLSQWHGKRPAHEQRRFLRSVDTMYKAFVSQENPAPPNRARVEADAAARAKQMEAIQQAHAEAAWRASEEDPLNGPPRSPGRAPPSLQHSASAPSNLTPIQVMEMKKRSGMHGDEEFNSLERWMEGGSVATATTGTTAASRYTSLTQMSKTTINSSVCSEPGTLNQQHYRVHKRGFAMNKIHGGIQDPYSGNMKGGLPNGGIPDEERLITTFKDQFGSRPLGEFPAKEKMYENIFKEESHPFVATFVENAKPVDKEQFGNLVRSMQYLRTAKKKANQSQLKNDLDLEENQRLWKPKMTKPWFEPKDANMSQVPGLGTLNKPKPKSEAELAAMPPPGPPPGRACPPSPSVSNLGSMPLSRLSTPAASLMGMTR